jgi:hypothetical protein
MFEAKLPYALVVTLGEHGSPGLAHARDHGDSRPGKPAPGQFVASAVLEQANKRSCSRPGQVRRISYQPPIVPCMASHLPPPGKPRRRCRGDCVQHRRELRVDGTRTTVEELQSRHGPIRRLVINDRPRQLLVRVLARRAVRPTRATVPRGHGADRSRSELTGIRDTPRPIMLPHSPPGFRTPGNDTQLGAQRVSQCRDKRELRPHLSRGEQAAYA